VEAAVEARDTEVAISFWKQKAKAFGNPPPIAEFSFGDLVGESCRFLILIDLLARDTPVFLAAYGARFAKLFGLPERSQMSAGIECIPSRYRFLFAEGCMDAISEAAPVRFSGEMPGLGGSELYRACFMPLRMGIDAMQAVYGSFNFLFRTAAELTERSAAAGSSASLELSLSVAKEPPAGVGE
jgi:hypothetical protein